MQVRSSETTGRASGSASEYCHKNRRIEVLFARERHGSRHCSGRPNNGSADHEADTRHNVGLGRPDGTTEHRARGRTNCNANQRPSQICSVKLWSPAARNSQRGNAEALPN